MVYDLTAQLSRPQTRKHCCLKIVSNIVYLTPQTSDKYYFLALQTKKYSTENKCLCNPRNSRMQSTLLPSRKNGETSVGETNVSEKKKKDVLFLGSKKVLVEAKMFPMKL